MLKYCKIWLILWFSSAVGLQSLGIIDDQHQLARTLKPPTFTHWFGFDSFGRDILAMNLQASLQSSLFALGATILSCLLGIIFGSGIALSPSKLRFFFLRILEFALTMPSLLIALTWAALWGPGWNTLFISLIFGALPSLTRLLAVRSQELLHEGYVTAARSLGSPSASLFYRHLMPALLSLCRVKIPNLFAHALLAEATLSFLGVGAPIGSTTWGSLLIQAKDYLLEAPHIAFGTGIPLVLTVISLQLLSESVIK